MAPSSPRRGRGSLLLRLLVGAASALLGSGCETAAPAGAQPSGSSAFVASAAPVAVDLPLPDFALVDQAGRPSTLADLRGKVWVADFIFTTCPSICPRLTEKMAALAERTKGEPRIRYVSFTVDPENDTPEKLTAFAAKYGADHARWSFLTGEPKHVEDNVLRGFKQVFGRGGDGMIFHSERFVLVDGKGHVRGFFVAEPADVERLEARARELLAELEGG